MQFLSIYIVAFHKYSKHNSTVGLFTILNNFNHSPSLAFLPIETQIVFM